jgi:hypothetical protein
MVLASAMLLAPARPAVAAQAADPAQRLARLEAGVRAAEAVRAVKRLQHAYAHFVDSGLWTEAAALFTADGSHESGGTVVRGREALRRHFMQQAGRRGQGLDEGQLHTHLVMQPIVTLGTDGRTAAARTTQVAMLGRGGEWARWELGVFENRFVKEDGRWKLAAVVYTPRLSTDYDLGWARDARQAPSPSATLPPDRPSGRFATYPARQFVGFHFVHPVTGRPIASPGGTALPTALVREGVAAPVADGADLAALEKQLHAVIAVDAVENLMSSYGYYLDESDWDGMADTYASRGAKEITGAGVYVGPERIRRVLKLRGPNGGRTPDFFTIHQLVQPVIHVSADGMSAHARLRLFQNGGSADGSLGSWIGGIYENTAYFENGEWKFGIQDLHHIFNASYRNGWARVGPFAGTLAGRPPSPRDERGGGITQGLGGARGGTRLAEELPPDRPIRARQYSFPEISEPAFHYVNPVSGRRPEHFLEH